MRQPLPGVWYYAHPYSVKNPDGSICACGQHANFIQCCVRTARLIENGWLIFSPICHSHPIEAVSPTMNADPFPWYIYDHNLIHQLNFAGLILAPGYSNSIGCQSEREHFLHHQQKKTILYYEEIFAEEP